MVFQEESFASRWWPLVGKKSPRGDPKKADLQTPVEERDALSFFDSMEKGLAHEFTEDFVRPLRQSNRLHRHVVKRSNDRLQYRLYKDDREQVFVMYAEVRLEAREVHFFLYDPDDKDTLFDADRPAFKMTFNPSKTEWMLSHYRDGAWYSPRQVSPTHSSLPKEREMEEVAFVQHAKVKVGDGVNHCLDADIARTEPTESSCSSQGSSDQQGRVVERLITRQAVWNEELQTLVLDFKGREVIPSAKNFQLACEGRPGRVVCQHGKIAKNIFGLDFRYPLNISQAFGMAITTLFWE
jgi:hypothetical protein